MWTLSHVLKIILVSAMILTSICNKSFVWYCSYLQEETIFFKGYIILVVLSVII